MTTRIDEAFAELEWHDAVLLSLTVDRRTPGERDEVTLLVAASRMRIFAKRFEISDAKLQ
jgi:hypothetical protein